MVTETDTTAPGLLPCPCCGGEARLEDMGWPHHVYCSTCGLRVTGDGYGEEGERSAMKKWNTRSEVTGK